MAPPGPPLSEDDAAAAETLAPAVHGGGRSHRGKVGVDLYLRKVCLRGGEKESENCNFWGFLLRMVLTSGQQCIFIIKIFGSRVHIYISNVGRDPAELILHVSALV